MSWASWLSERAAPAPHRCAHALCTVLLACFPSTSSCSPLCAPCCHSGHGTAYSNMWRLLPLIAVPNPCVPALATLSIIKPPSPLVPPALRLWHKLQPVVALSAIHCCAHALRPPLSASVPKPLPFLDPHALYRLRYRLQQDMALPAIHRRARPLHPAPLSHFPSSSPAFPSLQPLSSGYGDDRSAMWRLLPYMAVPTPCAMPRRHAAQNLMFRPLYPSVGIQAMVSTTARCGASCHTSPCPHPRLCRA